MISKTAAIWARVSSIGQRELSPEGQVDRVKTRLLDLGYSVPEECIFKVVWTSLDLQSCPEFINLQKLIRSQKINAVGFLDRDRIEAVSLQRLLFLSECKDNHVEPIVCQGGPFMTEPEGQLVELALALGKERSVLRAQSGAKQGLEDRVKKKKLPPTMKPPYGYIWKDNKLVPNEFIDGARLIWDMALAGIRLKVICKELTSRGIPTSRGKVYWQPSSVSAILKNPAYAGRVAALRYESSFPKERRKGTFGKSSAREKPPEEWVYLDGLVVRPIISTAQYNAVRERLDLNRQYSKRNTKGNYLLRGLIECQLCHRKYYGVQRTSHIPGYVCHGAWAQLYGKKCQAKHISCETLDEAVKTKIRNFLEHPAIYAAEASNKSRDLEITKTNLTQSITDLEKQLQDNIVYEQKALRCLSEKAFDSEQKVILTRRIWLEQEIKRQKAKIDDLDKTQLNAESIEAVRKQLQEKLDKATSEDWRMICEALSVKVYMFGDGTWDIEVNVPIVYEPSYCTCPY
jgi:site-specific DNA recombinase